MTAKADPQVILAGLGVLLSISPGIPWRRWLLWAGLIGEMALQFFSEYEEEGGEVNG